MQEAEEAAAAEVLKLTQELEMEEAGLQPFNEEDEYQDDQPDKAALNYNDNQNMSTSPNGNSLQVPDPHGLANLSEQQSYQLYCVQSGKPSDDLEDANNAVLDKVKGLDQDHTGADADNALLSEDEDNEQISSASDDPLRQRRRRVRKTILIT